MEPNNLCRHLTGAMGFNIFVLNLYYINKYWLTNFVVNAITQ